MHIMIASILIALLVFVLILVAFWLFTMAPFARHIDHSREGSERQNRPRFG